MLRKLMIAMIAVSVVAAVASDTWADKKNKANPKVYGKTIGEWGAEWWTWAYSAPDGANPVQDETGAFCDVNQPKGKVWFLAGSFGTTGVVRTCTIPKGKALFFPLVNAVWLDCPGSGDADIPDDVVRWIMSTFPAAGDPACQLTCTLDGVAISNLQIPAVRTQSPVFSVTLPEDNVANICGTGAPSPVGDYDRAIAEGYWVMLPPLSPGEHTVTLHGAGCNQEKCQPGTDACDDSNTPEIEECTPEDCANANPFFESGVTYHLTVDDNDDDDD